MRIKFSCLKRLFTLLLAVLMIIQVPLTALAESPGGSGASKIPTSYPGGAGSKGNGTGATAPIYKDYGFRVTISTSKQLQNAIEALGGDYTREQLQQQRDDVENYLKHIYYEPGNDGIYFWARKNRNIKPDLGVVSSYPSDGMSIRSIRLAMPDSGTTVTDKDNKLAWMCYEGISGGTRDTDTPYVQEMGDAVKNAATTYGSGDDFLYHLKTLYVKNGNISDFKTHIVNLMTNVVSNGDHTAQNIRNFSWDTELNQGAGVEVTAQDLVYWSQLGYLTMLIQFAWLAQETGNASTYEEFKNYIWAWVQGKDTNVLETMPILVIEACQEIDKTGLPSNSEANCQLITLPYTMSTNYGTDVVQSMYLGWDAGKDLNTALCEFVGTRAPVNSAVVGQALGYYIAGQQQQPPRGNANWGGRKFCKLLWPSDDSPEASFGYLIGFTYAAQSVPPTGTGTNNNAPVPGSFTWKLNPSGSHDMTPDTEVNEASTVYEINVSQNSYNQNNIDKWKTYIQQNGNNNNVIGFNVVRIEEDLADTKASQYTREQVLNQGTTVINALPRVVVGDATITNIPGGFSVKSGEKLGPLTNEQLINILNTGTGLALSSETIKGSLEQGIRVTYAVQFFVKVGNKSVQEFTNSQAEWVEYRSTPGTYEYKSDAPDGYAEIKCGYFNTDAYREPYEAMAGLPTTENLYFVSGGQEFVAQLKYEYTPNMTAVRNFEQKYQGTQCEGYWDPSTKHFDNATLKEIQDWMDKYTKVQHEDGSFINAKRCSVCGTLHTNGTGNEHIIATEYKGIVNDSDKLDPGNYYTELHLKAVAWDWHADGEDHEVPTGEVDEEGNEETETCELPEGDAWDVTDNDNDGKPDGVEIESCECGELEQEYKKVRVTRYTGDVVSYHVHYENGDGHQTNLGAIRWTQSYTGMNYAKIKEAHVWRLEQSKVNGIRQITFEDDDTVTGTGKELADVIFNVAESDTAKEGRMWYSIHPEDNDNYVGKLQLATRGCCHCFNHNAAEDLIASKDDPNQIFENAWCVSDYLVLNGYRGAASLLYHEYSTQNADQPEGVKIPILSIRVEGTPDNNAYIVKGKDGVEQTRGWQEYNVVFESQDISYNTYANALNGTEEAVCKNKETFTGGHIGDDDLSWAGYNGNYSQMEPSNPQIGKYQGIAGANNWKGVGTKKIFQSGYTHENQGEVNGFETDPVQDWKNLSSPFVLCVNDIKPEKVKVHNGRKKFSDSTIFYHNIISYGDDPEYSEDHDELYKEYGFHVDTHYTGNKPINDVVIHDPVSTQFARLMPLSSDLDQRVYDTLLSAELNKAYGKCPGTPNLCAYAHIDCKYQGDRIHTDACYVDVTGYGTKAVPSTDYDKRTGGNYTPEDFWFAGANDWTRTKTTLTSNGAYHLSGPNIQGIKGMTYRVTFYGKNLKNVTPTVWDDYKSNTKQNTSWKIDKQLDEVLEYTVTLGNNISDNAQTEFCLNANAKGVVITSANIIPLNYSSAIAGGTKTITKEVERSKTFDYKDQLQSWTVPSTGSYTIEARGAGGQNGSGAVVTSTMNLTGGKKLYIQTGQKGTSGNNAYGGGRTGGGGATSIFTDGLKDASPGVSGTTDLGIAVNYPKTAGGYDLDYRGTNMIAQNYSAKFGQTFEKIPITGNPEHVILAFYYDATTNPVFYLSHVSDYTVDRYEFTNKGSRILVAAGGNANSNASTQVDTTASGDAWGASAGMGGGNSGHNLAVGATNTSVTMGNTGNGSLKITWKETVTEQVPDDTPYTYHQLSCANPHHAPSLFWQRYTDGWVHRTGKVCTGVGCIECASGIDLYFPDGTRAEISRIKNEGYIIKHDGQYHLTLETDKCTTCGFTVTPDVISLAEDKTVANPQRINETQDKPMFDTNLATNPEYHYARGDETCWSACNDDDKHKVNTDMDANSQNPAGQFVVLDNDFALRAFYYFY